MIQPPGEVIISPGDNSLTLRWAPSPNAAAYRIYRRNPDGSWPGQPMEGTTHNEFVDLEVVNGQTYVYRVAAVDNVGNLSMAQEAAGTPRAAAVEKKGIPVGVLIGAIAATLVIAGGLGYYLGNSSGEQSGKESGYQAGKGAGVKIGAQQANSNYAPGKPGYKKIYDSGYEAGEAAGRKAGIKEGRAQGEEKGEAQGKAEGEKLGFEKGEREADATVSGGYKSWMANEPYIITINSTGNKNVPFAVEQRHLMEPDIYYYLCTSNSAEVCKTSSAPSSTPRTSN